MMQDTESALLTVEETAAYLRTTPQAIYTSRSRRLPPGNLAIRLGGRRLLFRRSDLERFIEEQATRQTSGARR